MASNTPAALRQARRRDRRARGFRCLSIEVGDADITGLIDRGLLDRMQQHDREAVLAAMHRFLDRTLAVVRSHG